MDRYPSPPLTSSPKHDDLQTNRHGSGHYGKVSQSTDSINRNGYPTPTSSNFPIRSGSGTYGAVPAPTDSYVSSYPNEYQVSGFPPPPTKVTVQDSYYNQEYYNGSGKHRPAQETYYQSTSMPTSPSQLNPAQHPYSEGFDPAHPSRPAAPPRRSSSPIPNTESIPSTYFPGTQPIPGPIRRRSSPTPGRIPSPYNHKPLSPYNASRPQPRPGLVRTAVRRLKSWVRSLISWIRNNPIKFGLLAFLPFLFGAGIWKTIKGVKHLFDHLIKNKWKKKGERLQLRDEWKEELKEGSKKAKKAVRKWHEDIFGDFKGFAGSNGGPLDGVLKIIQMMMNHYCRLTPSALPRAAAILLELYFIDVKKL
ncbi:hypothetical protein CJF32_00010853 [Rutstroemia sp. NJR-2017a WRK4]|nr:hypothetical protein CJF32_00010853 [Rutstroemia sp. NJR-2017a WRK4]